MPSLQRLGALARKEALQLLRDPSALLLAFVLPVVMLFLFAYAVSLDIRTIRLGVMRQSDDAASTSLAAAFAGSRYFSVAPARSVAALRQDLVAERLHGFVVIAPDVTRKLAQGQSDALVQIVTDGAQPNTAAFVANYAQAVVQQWLAGQQAAQAGGAATPGAGEQMSGGVQLLPRFWFNAELRSRWFLLPGAVAIIMTMIGTLLTALVMAREWERGTMEALLCTPVRVAEILLSKLLPYFALGLIATAITTLLVVHLFGVPLRGSWWMVLLLSATFLVPALGQGLLISTLTRSQFVAGQISFISAFLPSLLLSGFLFEIDAMPPVIQAISHLVAARYFIVTLQTVFLVGDVWRVMLPQMGAMLLIGAALLLAVRLATRKRLE
ncbi:MAG: ABC transporter permease [Burkholderiaceae bacterium]|jgi:ABC-2 type transport system permease protein|nr:ABC transporter permease [Burkholderiaceae bacterium]